MEQPSVPHCPSCNGTMQMERLVPALAGHPELRTYKCPMCKSILTVPIQRDVQRNA